MCARVYTCIYSLLNTSTMTSNKNDMILRKYLPRIKRISILKYLLLAHSQNVFPVSQSIGSHIRGVSFCKNAPTLSFFLSVFFPISFQSVKFVATNTHGLDVYWDNGRTPASRGLSSRSYLKNGE